RQVRRWRPHGHLPGRKKPVARGATGYLSSSCPCLCGEFWATGSSAAAARASSGAEEARGTWCHGLLVFELPVSLWGVSGDRLVGGRRVACPTPMPPITSSWPVLLQLPLASAATGRSPCFRWGGLS